ncbi:MAG TPA: prepilin-type N-terminal cleavage/methylation domain-containing protein [Acidimicrobiales bacterium]|nr:prepilin-type N-terminal cleavage/methylation domain-containing protein [Acidimicrobiales bacterium]
MKPRRRLRGAEESERGFTLIELMVVILIIAILLAIAIPTFLGARTRAQDRAAQSSLRNALTSADVGYANMDSYFQSDATHLTSLEPALTFCDATTQATACSGGSTSTSPNEISVAQGDVVSGPQQWGGAALSKSGTCFYVSVVKAGTGSNNKGVGTWYGQDNSSSAAANCTGAKALTVSTNNSWT